MKQAKVLLSVIKVILRKWFPGELESIVECVAINIWDIVLTEKRKSWRRGFYFGVLIASIAHIAINYFKK